jgi:hypothetical protein
MEKHMQDLNTILEAGLRLNDAAHHATGVAAHAIQNLSIAENMSSDCCSSNNYPTPPQ